MNNINLSDLPYQDLKKLGEDVEHELELRRLDEIQKMRLIFDQTLSSSGLSIIELFPEQYKLNASAARSDNRKRQATPPKFYNPDRPEETWTGKGRTPKWVTGMLSEKEISLDDFRGDHKYLNPEHPSYTQTD